jgi:hypothetical protein
MCCREVSQGMALRLPGFLCSICLLFSASWTRSVVNIHCFYRYAYTQYREYIYISCSDIVVATLTKCLGVLL